MSDHRVPDLRRVQSPPRRDLRYASICDGEVIGQGDQAIVRRASVSFTWGSSDEPAEWPIAVKEPRPPPESLAEEWVARFVSSAETWRRLDTRERQKQVFADSEHIVGVVDIGEDLPWIAMEYMYGGSLADRLEATPGGLPVTEALWIGECLCRGVKVAHDSGVAHLDLKPANVLFRKTPDGQWNVPKIGDWGFARELLDDPRDVKALSTEYAAPEQFDADRFGSVDKYTDVYQLGAVVYVMLTGQPPYTGSYTEIEYRTTGDDVPTAPSERRTAVPSALDDVVLTALSRAKADRYRGEVDRFREALHDVRMRLRRSNVGLTDWPMFRGGPARTGSAVPITIDVDEEESGNERMSIRVSDDSPIHSSPAVAGDYVLVGDRSGVRAFDIVSGEERGRIQLGTRIRSSPTIIGKTLYVGANDGCLYALNITTGERRWKYQTSGRIFSSPAVTGGAAYVGSWDGCIYAIHAETGCRLWSYETGGSVFSSPAVVDDTVYIGSKDGSVYALDVRTGDRRWQYETEGKVRSSPAVADDTVYAGSDDNSVYALNARTGDRRWQYETGGTVVSSPAVVDDTIYVGSMDSRVYALDAETGQKVWWFKTQGSVASSPAVDDELVYVGSDDGHMYILYPEERKYRTVDTEGAAWTSPAVADGVVWIGSREGYLTADFTKVRA